MVTSPEGTEAMAAAESGSPATSAAPPKEVVTTKAITEAAAAAGVDSASPEKKKHRKKSSTARVGLRNQSHATSLTHQRCYLSWDTALIDTDAGERARAGTGLPPKLEAAQAPYVAEPSLNDWIDVMDSRLGVSSRPCLAYSQQGHPSDQCGRAGTDAV